MLTEKPCLLSFQVDKGFTLIEVLVAVVVLAFGMLGLAGAQALSLRNNQSAYSRSQAAQLAYDLADRMRANTSALATYEDVEPNVATEDADCLATTGCTAVEMANHDLFEWNQMLTAALPGGAGFVAVASGVYTIIITWDDDRDGNAANNPIFQTSFRL